MLSVSVGVGTSVPTHTDESIAFIDKVDKQLYLAKQNGRNCIVKAG